MYSKTRLAVLILLLCGVISCEKGDLPFISCDIKQITSYEPVFDGGREPIEHNFIYNSWGAPVEVSSLKPHTGNPNFRFKYDNRRRLAETIIYYSETNLFTSTRYVYDRNGLIIRDTSFLIFDPRIYALTTYTYDRKLRISSMKIWRDGQLLSTTIYNYDSRGNLEMGPFYYYDDKVNILRTNPLWMFLMRDYSMNNRLPTGYALKLAYNKKGLLTSFHADDWRAMALAPTFLWYHVHEVVYDCGERRMD